MRALLLPREGAPSLGQMEFREVEIKAFGPQVLPLSDDLKRFGVRGAPEEGWACCLGLPEVWVEMKTHTAADAFRLAIRFVGLTQETPLAFAFYVKAASCQIGSEIFKPQSLRRFQGEVKAIQFQNQLTIESQDPHKVQLIPLAGDTSFWGSQFLLSFAIHPLLPQATFSFREENQ